MIVVIAAAISFSGCKKDDDAAEPEATTGNISVNCSVKDGALSLEVKTWDVTVKLYEGNLSIKEEKVSISGNVSFKDLKPATYSIRAEGYVTSTDGEEGYVSGETATQLNAGDNSSINLELN